MAGAHEYTCENGQRVKATSPEAAARKVLRMNKSATIVTVIAENGDEHSFHTDTWIVMGKTHSGKSVRKMKATRNASRSSNVRTWLDDDDRIHF
jgi:hypothetical protein